MRYIVLVLATYVAAVLQTVAAPEFEVRHVVPDLFALVAAMWLLVAQARLGFLAAAFVGLAADFTSGGSPGLRMALFAAVGCGIERLTMQFDSRHFAVRLGVIFAATAIIATVEGLALRLSGGTALSWSTLAVRASCVAAYTAAVSVPLVMVAGWLPQRKSAIADGASHSP